MPWPYTTAVGVAAVALGVGLVYDGCTGFILKFEKGVKPAVAGGKYDCCWELVTTTAAGEGVNIFAL